MIRKDAQYMSQLDWEPKVPNSLVIKQQVNRRRLKLSGNVRLALGRVIGREGIRSSENFGIR